MIYSKLGRFISLLHCSLRESIDRKSKSYTNTAEDRRELEHVGKQAPWSPRAHQSSSSSLRWGRVAFFLASRASARLSPRLLG
jgi:hypothetical protein